MRKEKWEVRSTSVRYVRGVRSRKLGVRCEEGNGK